MAQSEKVISNSDVVRMDLDELKRTNRDFDIDVDELASDLPQMAHHMTVRGKLEALVNKDVLEYDEMVNIYNEWKESKQ